MAWAQEQEVWCSFAPSADPGVALRLLRTDVSRVEISSVKPRALTVRQALLLSPQPVLWALTLAGELVLLGRGIRFSELQWRWIITAFPFLLSSSLAGKRLFFSW